MPQRCSQRRSPLDKDIPDAASEVAEGTRLWGTPELEERPPILPLPSLPPAGPRAGRSVLQLIVHVQPDPAGRSSGDEHVPWPLTARPPSRHVPTGIAVEGHIVRPVICVGIFSGDFGFQQVQGQLAPLEGHLARPLLQKASPTATQQLNTRKGLFPHHPPLAQGADPTVDSPPGPTKIPLFPRGSFPGADVSARPQVPTWVLWR